MPAPTNITPETAYAITTVPFTQTIDVTLAPTGTGYPSTCDTNQYKAVWYKWTAGANDTFIAFGRSSDPAASVAGKVSIWHGAIGSLTQYTVGAQNFCASLANQYFSVPVTPLTTYFFQVTTTANTAPAGNVVIRAQSQPFIDAPAGSVVISDDEAGFPAAVIDIATGELLQYVTFPKGEYADTMPTGEVCHQSASNAVTVYSAARVALATVTVGTGRFVNGIKSDRSNLFYIVSMNAGLTLARIYTVSKAGVLGGTTWDLPADSADLSACAVTRDGATFYYGPRTASAVIHAYDLVNDVPLTDLHTNFTTERASIDGDGYVAADGSILLGYSSGLDGANGKVRRFDAAGTVLNTYTLVDGTYVRLDHFCLNADSPASLLAWTFNVGLTAGRLQVIKLSDGSVLSTAIVVISDDSGEPPTGEPFAVSDSCPIFVLTSEWTAPPSSGGSGTTGYQTATLLEPRIRRAPHITSELQREFITKFQIHLQAGIGQGNGQGAEPLVMMRFSTDGGRTWSNERLMPAGRVGEFTRRCMTWRLGTGRDFVFEVKVTDPNVPWALVAAYLDAEAGNS